MRVAPPGGLHGVCPVGTSGAESHPPAPDDRSGAGNFGAAEVVAPPQSEDRAASAPFAIALTGLGVIAFGLLAAVARSRPEPDLQRGETVLLRGHPRKALLRYALSVGLWELTRRSTFFAVTQRRVILDHGVIRRHRHSIPLSSITDVDVVAGPWEGTVRIAERGTRTPGWVEIGPLRAPVARRLASTIVSQTG